MPRVRSSLSPRSLLRHTPLGAAGRQLIRYRPKRTPAGTFQETRGTGLFTAVAAAGPLAGIRFAEVNAAERDSILYGTMEPACTRLVAALDLAGEAAIDVGACYGYYALLLARRAGAGTVLALEPDIANLTRLAHNVGLNELPRVIPVAAAAASASGVQMIVTVAGAPWDSHLAAAAGREAGRTTAAAPVPTITLDELAETAGARVAFVKIDAEGVEPDVLRGASRLLEHDRPALLLELHEAATDSGVETILRAAGYEWQTVEHASDERSHILAFHPSRAATYEPALAAARAGAHAAA